MTLTPEQLAEDEIESEGDGELCEHGNLIDDEFCDECADAHWKLSDSFTKAEQP